MKEYLLSNNPNNTATIPIPTKNIITIKPKHLKHVQLFVNESEIIKYVLN